MRPAFALLQKFKSDERGAFLALFGLIAVVIIATSGAVVDFVSIEQARTRAQLALDSAALALQQDIYSQNETWLITRSQDLLREQINDPSITANVETASRDTVNGTLRLSARITVPTAFVRLIGVNSITAALVAEATRKRLNIEVAMVLDNSGSMASYSRISKLRTAANNAVNILFGSNATLPNVYVGVVPFTQFVNVGTTYANAAWMDRTGLATITRDNFDDDNVATTPFTAPFDRISTMNTLTNADWTGCVEARRPPYDTNDATPTASNPNTLFTPVFSPDEVGTPLTSTNWANSYLPDSPTSTCPIQRVCGTIETTTSCNSSGVCSGPTTTQNGYGFFWQNGAITMVFTSCSCSSYSYDDTSYSPASGNNRTRTRTRYCDAPLNNQELQERLCKYTGAIDLRGRSASSGSDNVRGPNADCPTNPILPLTNVKATIQARISALLAEGGTNIQQGAIWGYHILTPSEPFATAQQAGNSTLKVMIVMTDGENVAYSYADGLNGSNVYSAYGYPRNNRLGAYGWTASQLETEMNTRTVTTCNNAKADGIVIYTIGLSSPNSTTQNMLKDCSSGSGYWFFPNDPDELNTIFTTIASQLAELRLAR
jgi:Flp pilus assembly protein TadG